MNSCLIIIQIGIVKIERERGREKENFVSSYGNRQKKTTPYIYVLLVRSFACSLTHSFTYLFVSFVWCIAFLKNEFRRFKWSCWHKIDNQMREKKKTEMYAIIIIFWERNNNVNFCTATNNNNNNNKGKTVAESSSSSSSSSSHLTPLARAYNWQYRTIVEWKNNITKPISNCVLTSVCYILLICVLLLLLCGVSFIWWNFIWHEHEYQFPNRCNICRANIVTEILYNVHSIYDHQQRGTAKRGHMYKYKI